MAVMSVCISVSPVLCIVTTIITFIRCCCRCCRSVAAAGNLADHGADVAAAVLERINGSSSSSNGAASNGSSSSNGNGTAAIAAAVDALPAQLVPADSAAAAAGAAEPGACIASADGSWARNIVINGDDNNVLGAGVVAVTPDGRKLRHPVRPPVVHRHGCGPLQPNEPPVPPVSIFRHPLLQHFMLTVFCKLPVVSLSSMADLKYSFMVRLILSAFQFRINQRCGAAAFTYLFCQSPFPCLYTENSSAAHLERLPVQQ
jgi:hypothetical protein